MKNDNKLINQDILTINPDIVCSIVVKTQEFQAKESVTFDESISDSEYENDYMQILADHQDDLTYREVSDAINNLEPDQKIDLLALMYLGRGDFDNWAQAHKEAKENLKPNLAHYLIAHPLIPSYLENGLVMLGYSCFE